MKKIKRTKLNADDNILRKGSCWIVQDWNTKKKIERLQQKLGEMTDYRCSYCDKKEIKKGLVQGEIEHFLPKDKKNGFPNLKFVWHNLFWSCPQCNSFKSNKYYKIVGGKKIKPVKPDLENTCSTKEYSFNQWFRIDFDTGKILSVKKNNEWKRAEWTIELLQLNHPARLKSRKKALEDYLFEKNRNIPFNHERRHLRNFSYSFYIEDYLKIHKIKYNY